MNKNVLLGVTGSIAAYKGADIASKLVRTGYNVQVVMTSNAAELISPVTFEALTSNKVYVDMFKDENHGKITHISLAAGSDLILVAPATYNIIGKVAAGIADDLLSTILAAAPPFKVIFAPAMNTNMYANPALLENINKLTERGYSFIEPEEGVLACGTTGKGRLRDIQDILDAVDAFFCEKSLSGKNVLITAGATREFLDPIRFISNTSSGLMGVSLAKACRNMGAKVTLILANSQYDLHGINLIRVNTVSEMYRHALDCFDSADLVFAAAAVSDFRPKTYSTEKLKKTQENLTVEFELNTDILLELGKRKKNQYLVGFAAESGNLKENALSKLRKKNLDLIVANYLDNFSSHEGKVWLISHDNAEELISKPKDELAYDIMHSVLDRWIRP